MIIKPTIDAILGKVITVYDNLIYYYTKPRHIFEKSVNSMCEYLNYSLEEKLMSATIFYVANKLMDDAKAIYNNDPAANSVEEVIICYPGFKAIFYHRIANLVYHLGNKTLARCLSEHAHSETGIDIHPGANIGNNFAIDHGTGIVIGETTEIGENVTIYQGVTLGAIHLENREQRDEKRHPTIEDNVVIYANATILGGKTVIGKNSVIGANTFITKSVPEGSKILNSKGEL